MVPRDFVAARLSPAAVKEQLRILFHNHIEERQVNRAKVAERMEMSPRNLQRILAGDGEMTTKLLVDPGDAFGIDKSRAGWLGQRGGPDAAAARASPAG